MVAYRTGVREEATVLALNKSLETEMAKFHKGYVGLFQYGSNMSSARLNSPKRLNKRARRPFRARLDAWGIRFDLYSKCNASGVTDIVQVDGEYVMGVVYKVPVRLVYAPTGKRSKMDEIEGTRTDGTGNYQRKRINVVNGRGETIPVVTYIGTEHGTRRFLRRDELDRRVSRTYFSHLLKGAHKFRFADSYISYLQRQAGILKG